uniref:Uncharacterized protein n=1 Tax=Fundulus heteroclitus TaxID=8078 RepID=A0A3Q2PFW7_FUNHE
FASSEESAGGNQQRQMAYPLALLHISSSLQLKAAALRRPTFHAVRSSRLSASAEEQAYFLILPQTPDYWIT